MLTRSYLTQLLSLGFVLILLIGCSTTKTLKNPSYEVKFIDEYTLPINFEYKNEIFGGISGIDFKNGELIMVNDSPSNPLIFTAELNLDGLKLDTLVFTSVLKLNGDVFFKENALDMESIRFDGKDYLISTEGNINKNLSPRIFKISNKAKFIENYPLPDYFLPKGNNYPRQNGVFEGLTMSLNSKGFWFANELPLENDGKAPKLYNTNSPIRISYFDRDQNQVTRQYVMDLDRISKIPFLPFAINGLTEILQLENNKFLVLERAYSAGHKSQGNRVKLFLVDISDATNTKDIKQLKSTSEEIIYTKKSLLFDFKNIKSKLTNNIIDNLEGLCFGPILPNGNRTLIIASDDNFNSFGLQLNQFIVLELKSN